MVDTGSYGELPISANGVTVIRPPSVVRDQQPLTDRGSLGGLKSRIVSEARIMRQPSPLSARRQPVQASRSMPQIWAPSCGAGPPSARSSLGSSVSAGLLRAATPSLSASGPRSTWAQSRTPGWPHGAQSVQLPLQSAGATTPSAPAMWPRVPSTTHAVPNAVPTSSLAPTAMKVPMSTSGAIPPSAMQMLENKFKDIVEVHVQALLATLEGSLESHHSELSGRIDQVEIRMGQPRPTDSPQEKQEHGALLDSLRHQVNALTEEMPLLRSGQTSISEDAAQERRRLTDLLQAQRQPTLDASPLVERLEQQLLELRSKFEASEVRQLAAESAVAEGLRSVRTSEKSLVEMGRSLQEVLANSGARETSKDLGTGSAVSSRVEECFSGLREVKGLVTRLDAEVGAEVSALRLKVSELANSRSELISGLQMEAFRSEFRTQLHRELAPVGGSFQAQGDEIAALSSAVHTLRILIDANAADAQKCWIKSVSLGRQARRLDDEELRCLTFLVERTPSVLMDCTNERPVDTFTRLHAATTASILNREDSMTAGKLRPLLATEISEAAAHGKLSGILEQLGPFEESGNSPAAQRKAQPTTSPSRLLAGRLLGNVEKGSSPLPENPLGQKACLALVHRALSKDDSPVK